MENMPMANYLNGERGISDVVKMNQLMRNGETKPNKFFWRHISISTLTSFFWRHISLSTFFFAPLCISQLVKPSLTSWFWRHISLSTFFFAPLCIQFFFRLRPRHTCKKVSKFILTFHTLIHSYINEYTHFYTIDVPLNNLQRAAIVFCGENGMSKSCQNDML